MFKIALLVVASFATPGYDGGKEVAKLPKNLKLETEVGDISGYYSCEGQEAGGKTYNGVVTIRRKNDVYVVQWVIGEGSNFTGVGIRQGNGFSAGWASPGPNGVVMRGVNTYRIDSISGSPRLSGRWTSLPGNGLVQSETLTFLKAMD